MQGKTLRSLAERTGWSRYLEASRTPLHSLIVLLPCLVAYEFALRWSDQAVRNGADMWLDRLLQDVGSSPVRWLPLATIVGLLAWHYVSGRPWSVQARVVGAMVIEAGAYAVLLAFVGGLVWARLSSGSETIFASHELSAGGSNADHGQWYAELVYCGAGVYEELLFRAILLPITIAVLLRRLDRRRAVIVALTLTSLLFALVHYDVVNPYGEPFAWESYWFRTAAGLAFGGLFLARGLGIAAIAHVGYDLLAS